MYHEVVEDHLHAVAGDRASRVSATLGSMRALRALAATLLGLTGACTLVTSLDGYAGVATPEAVTPDVTPADAADAATPDGADSDGGGLPVVTVIAQDVGVAYAAGAAQGSHLHYAKNAGVWVFFLIDAAHPDRLSARVSPDFITWSDGGTLGLPEPHPADGRSFAVSYADLGGKDVFHLALSLQATVANRSHFHARATIAAKAVVFETPVELGRTTGDLPLLDPDGPSVAVIANGTVLDASGWHSLPEGNYGDAFMWTSTAVDNGASWTSGFASPTNMKVVPSAVNARLLLPTAFGAIALWEDGETDPNPKGIDAAELKGGSWAAPRSAGFASDGYNINDWSAAVDPTTGVVHVVRKAGKLEHRIFDGNAWTTGSALPPASLSPGDGVVVVADGDTVSAFVVDGAVARTTLSASGWSAWTEVVAADASKRRSGLAGRGGPGGVALAWTETQGSRIHLAAAKIR